MTTRRVAVARGRTVTLDDVGAHDGVPLVYLHGTPDSRLARPGDDGLAAEAGIRLLALDRPGYGGSDPLPLAASSGAGDPGGCADWTRLLSEDIGRVLDAVAVERCAVLAWSGGALAGLALAARLPARVSALGIVPRQAYGDLSVRDAGAERTAALELAEAMPPGERGDALAPLLAPYPCDRALALEHQADQRDAAGARELAAVPGGAERMADALVEAVRHGLAGIAADVETQARPFDVDLAALAHPVRLWYGAEDTVAPPEFGRWYARNLPDARLDVVDGAAHFLLFIRWSEILSAMRGLTRPT
jgi:pimeloyl-ACP methyl ester carboxylesterase